MRFTPWLPDSKNKIEKSLKHNEMLASKLTDEIMSLSAQLADPKTSDEEKKKIAKNRDKKIEERNKILQANQKIHTENPL